MKNNKIRYLYFAHDGAPTERVKIGISIDVPARLKALKCRLLFALPCEHRFARVLERALHDQCAGSRCETDEFFGGYTEWFNVTPDLSRLIQCVRLTGQWPWDGTKVVL